MIHQINFSLRFSTSGEVTIIPYKARYMLKSKRISQLATPYYISPEVIKENFDEKCDIWSCGVILYILLCGYPPFSGVNDIEIKNSILSGKYYFQDEEWSNVTAEAKDLIRNMLCLNVKSRFSAKDCLDHCWIKKFDDASVKPEIMKNTLTNIKKFHVENKLQKAALSYIAHQIISKEEQNKLIKQFQFWDKNGYGVLSRDEIYEGYKQMFGELKAKEDIVIY